jgi:hypothetical protein
MQMVTKAVTANDEKVFRVGYLTVKETAKFLGMHEPSFRVWVNRNRDKLDYRLVGHTGILGLSSVLNLRNSRAR